MNEQTNEECERARDCCQAWAPRDAVATRTSDAAKNRLDASLAQNTTPAPTAVHSPAATVNPKASPTLPVATICACEAYSESVAGSKWSSLGCPSHHAPVLPPVRLQRVIYAFTETPYTSYRPSLLGSGSALRRREEIRGSCSPPALSTSLDRSIPYKVHGILVVRRAIGQRGNKWGDQF